MQMPHTAGIATMLAREAIDRATVVTECRDTPITGLQAVATAKQLCRSFR
jgi:hypothetical protein